MLTVPGWASLRFVTRNTLEHKVLLCALLALIGIGESLASTTLMAEFTKTCAQMEQSDPNLFGKRSVHAQASSLFIVSFAVGCLLGTFAISAIGNAADWAAMTLCTALLCGITVVPVVLYTGGPLWRRTRKVEAEENHSAADGMTGTYMEK